MIATMINGIAVDGVAGPAVSGYLVTGDGIPPGLVLWDGQGNEYPVVAFVAAPGETMHEALQRHIPINWAVGYAVPRETKQGGKA